MKFLCKYSGVLVARSGLLLLLTHCWHRTVSNGNLKKKTLDWSVLCLQFAAAQDSGILDWIKMKIALHES